MKKVFGFKNQINLAKDTAIQYDEKTQNKETIVLTDEYDILNLHNKVIKKLNQEYQTIDSKKDKIKLLLDISKNGKTISEVKKALNEISKLEEEICDLENKVNETKYLKQSQPLINEFIQLNADKKNRTFGLKKVTDESTIYKKKLIKKFLFIAEKYINIDIIVPTTLITNCIGCGEKVEEGNTRCENCPVLVEELEKEASYKDNEKTNAPTKNNYIKSEHIKDAFIKLQGKQQYKIPDYIMSDIQDTVKSYNIKPEDLTLDTLFEILRNKKYSNFYDDIYLIYHIITNKPLLDLREIEKHLFNDADEFANAYQEVKPSYRSNCLNAHYVRDVLLRRKGYVFPEWKCTSLQTESVNNEHNEIMKKVFELKGWENFKPL